MAGKSLTPEALRRQTTEYIQEQVRSGAAAFHPQLAGSTALRNRPLKLVALSGGNGILQQNTAALAEKNHVPLRIHPNKTCFEPGDVLEIAVEITDPGYLNVMSVAPDNQSTVLFPNRYHPHNAVAPGYLNIPGAHMEYELVSSGPPGPHLITAFLTRSPLTSQKHGFNIKHNAAADFSPDSTRFLISGPQNGYLAASEVTVEIRQAGRCE
jgi:hypothetical protein